MAVEHVPVVLLRADAAGVVLVLANQRAVLDCGCACYCGLRLGTTDPATLTVPCSDEHRRLAAHFNLLLKESLVAPTERLLVDVADELLEQAVRYGGARA